MDSKFYTKIKEPIITKILLVKNKEIVSTLADIKTFYKARLLWWSSG